MIKSWRTPHPHKPLFGQKVDPIPATRFFDQLSFIGTPNVGCFAVETDDGFFMIDCMEPYEEHRDIIVKGIADLGLDLKDLKAILITHGHGDHYGTADWFREQTGCKIFMSRVDYAFAQQDTRNRTGVLKWEINDFIEDGEVYEQGGVSVHAFATPGHTPGCLSFIFNVTDEGRPHTVAIWGGSGVPYHMTAKMQYLESCLYFAEITERFGVDAEIASHPFIDMGCERLAICRELVDGLQNPFVLGHDGYKQMEKMYLDMCIASLKDAAVKADEVLPPMPPLRPRK